MFTYSSLPPWLASIALMSWSAVRTVDAAAAARSALEEPLILSTMSLVRKYRESRSIC
jgi:hypothetical protein